MTDLWRCTVCGQVSTVGRCCGDETREPWRPIRRKDEEETRRIEAVADRAEQLEAEIEALRAEVERVTCELMDAIAHAEKLAEASRQLASMYERATGLPCPPQLRRAIAALRERLVERDIKD